MIKAFISKVAEGKSMCAIAECASQKNKRIAYVTTEISDRTVLQRLKAFDVKCEKFVVFYFPRGNTALSLYKKIENISEDFDIICIDSPLLIKDMDLQKLNDACFKSFMNQCTELWITIQANRTIEYTNSEIIKKNEIENLLKIKQICSTEKSPLLPGETLIKAIDLETKEIKIYNLSNLFKNKNL